MNPLTNGQRVIVRIHIGGVDYWHPARVINSFIDIHRPGRLRAYVVTGETALLANNQENGVWTKYIYPISEKATPEQVQALGRILGQMPD